MVDDQFVMVISQSDADYEALEVGELASVLADAIEESILYYRINRSSGARVEPLFSAPFPAELAQQSFNRLAAEWEDEDTVKELSS